jgi:hypothetical protein
VPRQNIEFEPRSDLDYWPSLYTSTPGEYPMGPYALGFIAAITIEAEVRLDSSAGTALCPSGTRIRLLGADSIGSSVEANLMSRSSRPKESYLTA